jgi:hypothetical protein
MDASLGNAQNVSRIPQMGDRFVIGMVLESIVRGQSGGENSNGVVSTDLREPYC